MKPITIVGGGLAGLALGILLRREGIPVRLFEAGKYPRHRVCGEFLSGKGRDLLREIGPRMDGAVDGKSASFFWKHHAPIRLDLPAPALCLSRLKMDAALADEFQRLGGELRANERFVDETKQEGVVQAGGRRRASAGHGHLFGLKAHALNARLDSDLELHFGPRHYVGLCRLSEDRVNVCGLFYSDKTLPEIQTRWREILSEAAGHPALEWDAESFCAVAGLTLTQFNSENEFSVGDAAAMIPPLTGNGMSMAFESASLAAPELQRYSVGKVTWQDAMARHAAAWRRTFGGRLRWAGFTQRLVFDPIAQGILFRLARLFPALPKLLFHQTR